MKRYLACVAFTALFLFGCFQTDWVDKAKSGYLKYSEDDSVGEVLDNWTSCQNVSWRVLDEQAKSAQVKYTCNVQYTKVAGIIDSLKDRQAQIKQQKTAEIEKHKKTLTLRAIELKAGVCASTFLLDKLAKGVARKREDSRFSKEELTSYVTEYQKLLSEVASKVAKNNLKKQSEYNQYNDKLTELSDKFSSAIQSDDILGLQGPTHLIKPRNRTHKKLQAALADCYKANKISYQQTWKSPDEIGLGHTALSTYNEAQQSLLDYEKNFDNLTGIAVNVEFEAYKKYPIRLLSTYFEFNVGNTTRRINYTSDFILGLAYKNLNLPSELTNENKVKYLTEFF